jgi:hypothetical protein
MTHYLILAEGGCYGNFLACVIRSMWDLNFTKQVRVSDSGSCDSISGAGEITKLMQPFNMYPENSLVADRITAVLKTKEYTSNVINTFHYVNKDSVDKFLTADNVKVIYVTQEEDDYRLIALNKISKNFDNVHNLNHVKKDYLGLLNFYNKRTSKELETLTDCTTMSKELKEDLVSAWQMYMTRRINLNRPEPDERILFVKFKDIISNENKVLEDLEKFTNSKINETSIVFYKQYLEAQKKVWDYVNN